MTTYFIKGTSLQLTDRDFLAEGGEGKVYVQGSWAYKIFHDPKRALPKAKLIELAKLDRPEILGPRRLIENQDGTLAGYAMPFGKLPQGARDLTAIPRGHRAWLEDVLEHGARTAPPAAGALGAPVVTPMPVPSSGKVSLELIAKYPARIRDVLFYEGTPYVVTSTGVFQGNTLLTAGSVQRKFALVPTEGGAPIWAEWNAQREELTVQLTNKTQIIPTQSFTVIHGRLWTTDGTYLRENKIVRFGPNLTLLSTRPAAGAVPTARFGDGILVQPMPGSDRFSLLLKTGGVQTIKIPELAGWRILAATGRERLVQALGRKNNDLQLVTVICNDAGVVETTLIEPWADYEVPSLVITAKGIVVRITKTELRLWRDPRQPTVIPDPGLNPGARLWVDGTDVYASEAESLWRVRTT